MKERFNGLKERIKENFNKNKVIVLAFVILWIACVFGTLSFYKSSLGKKSYGNISDNLVVELDKKTKIEQIVPSINEAKTFVLKVATYARKNTGSMFVKVEGVRSNKTYLSNEYNIKTLEDNSYIVMDLNETLNNNVDPELKISISSDSEPKSSIGIYYSDESIDDNTLMYINDELVESELTYRFLTDNYELSLFFRNIIIYIICAISFVILLITIVKPDYEILFASIVLVIGIAFCFVMTPVSIPDEMTHYEYSFQISNYIMGEKNHLEIDADYLDYGSYVSHRNVSTAYEKIVKRFNSKHSLDNVKEILQHDVDEVYAGGFFVQGVGITLARLLDLNRVKTFYMGRLFNLIFYVVCIYVTIKKTPVHKLLFGLLSVMPVFIQQAASYSYDCFVNGLTFVTLAYLLKFILVEEEINIKEYITILIVCVILAPEKIVYSIFSFLFWIVPAKRFGNKRRKFFGCLLLNVSAIYQLCNIMFPIFFKIFINAIEITNNGVKLNRYNNVMSLKDTTAGYFDTQQERITVGYIMRHPFQILDIIFRTLRYNIKNWFYSSIGRSMSGESLILPVWLVHMIVAIPFVAAFFKEEYVESIPVKLAFVFAAGLVAVYIMIGFLLSWTNTDQELIEDFGGPVIEGIQGRYFSPLMPFFFTVFNNRKICIPRKFDTYVIYAYLLVIFEVLVYILSYTFIN